jgi:UDPglucose 6-dehydrogenase/GDP-mannose 6-dehydrogenase
LVRAHNHEVAVASNPEFLREGSAVRDFLESDRIVIGSNETWAADLVADLYAPLKPFVVHTVPSTAELAKCASNALLATLISFSNQLARIAEAVPGAEVEEVLSIIHKDQRLSPMVDGQKISPEILVYLKPGLGFGGACLPKDLSALNHFANFVGEPAPLLKAVMEINDSQPARVVSITRDALDGLKDRRVAVLGLAFKAGTDDLRDSPSLRIVDLLLREGAEIVAYDPLVALETLEGLGGRGVTFAADLDAAIREADACLIATRAPEFREVGEILLRMNREHTVVIDGRRLLDPESLEERHRYRAVGRSQREFPKRVRVVTPPVFGMAYESVEVDAAVEFLGPGIESFVAPLPMLASALAWVAQSFA